MNDAEWFAEHTAYLASPEWAFKRGQVLNRDGYRCRARLDGCEGDANQAHHLSYKHWRSEPLFDLIAVCAACHEQITKMDRQNRAPDARVGGALTGLPIWERPSILKDVSAEDRIRALLRERGRQSMETIARLTGLPRRTVESVVRHDYELVESCREGEAVFGFESDWTGIPDDERNPAHA